MSDRENRREANKTAVLAALDSFVGSDYGASYRDLQEATGLGLGTVFSVVRDLVDAGLATHTPVIARSIRRVTP